MIGFLRPVATLIAIPTLGICTGVLISYFAAPAPQADTSYCETLVAGIRWPVTLLDGPCSGKEVGELIVRLSVYALLLAVAPVVVFALAAQISGTNRDRIARIFPPLMPPVVVAVFLNVLAQGLLLMLTADAATMATFTFWAVLGVFGVVVAAVGVLWSTIRALLFRVMPVHGAPVTPEQAPGLWALVDGTAQKLLAPRPQHILLGLAPGFWVAEGAVAVSGSDDQILKGRILYLSAPLLRILDRGEITSIIGHELGHFLGADTEYSARFVPVYGTLMGAHAGLDRMSDSFLNESSFIQLINSIVNRSTRAFVDILIACFERNVRAIDREREYAADRAAIEVAPPRTFATAMVKTSLYSGLWEQLYWIHLALTLEGRGGTENPAATFAGSTHLYCDGETAERLTESALENSIVHPFDSHPSNLSRIRRAGIDPATVSAGAIARRRAEGAGPQLVPGLAEIETALNRSVIEANRGHIEVPGLQDHAGEKLRPETLRRIFDALCAVLAPFVISAPDPARQFRAVLDFAAETESRFDGLAFGALCTGEKAIPPLDGSLRVLEREMGDEGRGQIVEYLRRLADGLDPDASGPGGPEALARLMRHFEKPPPTDASQP